jgi:DDE superfamily endonuclease
MRAHVFRGRQNFAVPYNCQRRASRLIYRVHHGRRSRDDRRKGFTETDYAQLLDDAHQQLGGPLVVVWDGLNTHVSRAMVDLVAARDWLTVFRLPPYAHELNPVESVWSHLKRSLANLAKRDISQLTALVKTRLRRMQYRPRLLDGFLVGTRLDLTPFCKPPQLRVLPSGRALRSLPALPSPRRAAGGQPCSGSGMPAGVRGVRQPPASS